MDEALAARFIHNVAILPKEGEEVGSIEYEWENDDAWETLQSLISWARNIAGLPDIMSHPELEG